MPTADGMCSMAGRMEWNGDDGTYYPLEMQTEDTDVEPSVHGKGILNQQSVSVINGKKWTR